MLDIKFWAGTPESLLAYTSALKRVMSDGTMAKADAYSGQSQEQRAPRLFSKQGDIGVITISGSLNNTDSWINEFIGATGYPEIRAALIYAASNPDIKAIALDIKSGGGAVSGVSDTADLISTISNKVKPVYAYSDGIIASAAYWLGASAKSLAIGKVTEAGSIGVLVVHQDISKMLENDGITVNVIRSGKYKALGHSAEVLSELGKEVIQAQVDQLNGMFVAHVAQARGTTADVVERKMGQGRVFIGQDAVDVGLADTLSNFDEFMGSITRGIDSSKQQPKYGANSPKGIQVKTALTDQQIAAMALGVAQGNAGEQKTAEQLAAEAAAVQAAEKEATDKAAADAEVAAKAAADAAAAEAAKPSADAVVALLQTQLAAAQAQVVAVSVELQGAKATAESAKKSAEDMRPIVRAAVGNLRVAMGGTAAGVEVLADDSLMAEHANLHTQFLSKFKAGGVAAVSSSGTAEGSADATAEAIRQNRLKAVRNTTTTKAK